jgi:hypothetical protein
VSVLRSLDDPWLSQVNRKMEEEFTLEGPAPDSPEALNPGSGEADPEGGSGEPRGSYSSGLRAQLRTNPP